MLISRVIDFVYIKINSADNGKVIRKLNKKQQTHFENQCNLLNQNLISQLDFLKNMSEIFND